MSHESSANVFNEALSSSKTSFDGAFWSRSKFKDYSVA